MNDKITQLLEDLSTCNKNIIARRACLVWCEKEIANLLEAEKALRAEFLAVPAPKQPDHSSSEQLHCIQKWFESTKSWGQFEFYGFNPSRASQYLSLLSAQMPREIFRIHPPLAVENPDPSENNWAVEEFLIHHGWSVTHHHLSHIDARATMISLQRGSPNTPYRIVEHSQNFKTQ